MTERLRIALLVSVTALVYGNTLGNGFTLDDFLYIFQNPAVTRVSLKGLFEATQSANVFRPATFASLAVNWFAGGAHAWGYHFVNLLLHAAVTVLLYLLLKKLLETVPLGMTVAWVTALLFAVHPIHTEAVASIVGRSELLAAGFLLAAWLLHLQDRTIPALLFFLLALMSKESAVVFLPLAWAGDALCGKRKPLARYVSIAAAGALYMGLFWKIKGGRFGEKGINFLDNPLAHLPASLRIVNALRIAWKYLGLQIFPATLSADYSYNAILLYSNWQHTLLPALAAIVVFLLWIWAIVRRKFAWALAGTIYLVGFSATSNLIVPSGTIMGERLAYLPSAGFCLLVALLWMLLEKRQSKLAWTVLTILLLGLSVRTVVRNRDWHDNFALFSATVRAVPESAKAHAGLGGEFLRRDDPAAALHEFQTSVAIYPDFADVWDSYGLAESRLGHDQEALPLFEKSLAMTAKDDPNYDYVAVNLAGQLMKLGKNEEALKLLNDEIANSPGYSRAWADRAAIWYQRGELASARADAQAALRLDPSNLLAQNVLFALNTSNPAALQP
ncbi:MAG TPA: tetratricopeptide repeat protein [Candidatus Acidoferrum sp.]|nr:tetratricopeptide repeat protein [Candidatus Acidoferrum sp.]